MGAASRRSTRVTQARSCGTCTKCCEGWLPTTVYGQEIKIGSPCRYVQDEVGCSIYQERPFNPCVKFQCAWLQDETIPDWVRPKESGVIAVVRDALNPATRTKWLYVYPSGSPVSDDYRAWAKMYAKQHGLHYSEEQ